MNCLMLFLSLYAIFYVFALALLLALGQNTSFSCRLSTSLKKVFTYLFFLLILTCSYCYAFGPTIACSGLESKLQQSYILKRALVYVMLLLLSNIM